MEEQFKKKKEEKKKIWRCILFRTFFFIRGSIYSDLMMQADTPNFCNIAPFVPVAIS